MLFNNKNKKDNSIYFVIIIIIALVFIGPRFSDKIPLPLLKLFLNHYFRVLIVFFAIYMIQYNIFLSILITLIFLILMNKIENNVLFELFLNSQQNLTVDHFNDYNQVLDPVDNLDDEEYYEYDTYSAYNGSKEMLQCMNTINDHFPCNNRNGGRNCCENTNYDVMIKDKNGDTKNMTIYMNKQLENKNMQGIKNIHKWCKIYNQSKNPQSKLDIGCTKDSLVNKCKEIMTKCNFVKPPIKPKTQYDFSGTCGAVDENIHDQVCFDIDPKQNKCKKLDKDQCIKNKKDCFYIKNNQFINSKIRKDNNIYKCKIPKAEEPLPDNCFPIKLYKDTCGNVGMGCWVKDKEIPKVSPEKPKPIPYKPKIKIYKKTDKIVNKHLPTINYRTPNNIGNIINKSCH
jgi:hypothetical protein